MTTPTWKSLPPTAPHSLRPAIPPNVQTFQINYDNGAYIMVSIDISSYTDFYYVPDYPGYSNGSTGGFTPPSWLTACNVYNNSGSLLYVITDLDGLFASAGSGNPNPFAAPVNFPAMAFFTTDLNLYAQGPNNLVIDNYGYNTNIVSISSSYYTYTCFKEGSKILTDHGYKPIEQLRKGDNVMTYYHGLKAIDMIGYREIEHPATPDRIKDQLYKCSPAAYPELIEDLVLTGAHSILVTQFKDKNEEAESIRVNGDLYVTDGKGRLPACVDERATVYETAGSYMIYHLALEHDNYYMNYGVYANGLLVETCSKRYMKELSGMKLLE